MATLSSPLLALALLAPAAPPEKPKPVDYEQELNDKMGLGITAEQNSQAKLMFAFGPKPEGGTMPAEFYKRLGIEEPPEQGDYIIGIGKFVRDHLQLDQTEFDGVFQQQSWASNRPWEAKDYPFIGAWVKANEKPLAVVHEAVKRPKYYNPLISKKNPKDDGSLIGALLPSVQKCREVAALLSARAMLRLQEGKTDEAWADLMACHRLARHVAHGGTLIELLVGIAIDAIASNADIAFLEHAKLDSKQVLEKLKDLQSLPPFPKTAEKIDLAERYMYLDSLNLIRRGGLGVAEGFIGGAGGSGKPSDEELKALGAMDWTPTIETGKKWYDRMTDAVKRPTRAERNRVLDAIEAELKLMKERYVDDKEKLRKDLLKNDPDKVVGRMIGELLISLLAPSIRKVQDASDRQVQAQANLQTAFAIVAYQREHGKYPARLEDIAPKYLAKLPGDVFSGGSQIYKPEAKGFLLYSVGANGMDEGGRWFDDEPRGDDPRVRIPQPELKKD